MHQTTMQTAVSVCQRMDINKSERNGRSLQDRIDVFDIRHTQTVIALVQPRHQIRKVLWAGANKLRYRIIVRIPLTKEDPLLPVTNRSKTVITNQNVVESVDFGLI